MAKVGVIGGGAFGTAMAAVLARSGHEILLWALEPEVVADINGHHRNRHFLPDVDLDARIVATSKLEDATGGREFVVLAVPAQHLRGVAHAMAAFLAPGAPVVSCSKGIERGTCALMPQVIAQALPQATVAVLSGPSFAGEIARDLPCGVALACADRAVADRLARAIANPRFCVYPSTDVIGTAVGGVMKNVVSVGSGIVAGRKLGENARATLITLGLAETIRLGLAMGAVRETFDGLAGVADMMLTANSLHSRNTSLGVALGEGRSLAEVLGERRQVTEGAFSTEAVATLAARLRVDMPIAATLHEVLNRGASIDDAMARLTERLAQAEAR